MWYIATTTTQTLKIINEENLGAALLPMSQKFGQPLLQIYLGAQKWDKQQFSILLAIRSKIWNAITQRGMGIHQPNFGYFRLWLSSSNWPKIKKIQEISIPSPGWLSQKVTLKGTTRGTINNYLMHSATYSYNAKSSACWWNTQKSWPLWFIRKEMLYSPLRERNWLIFLIAKGIKQTISLMKWRNKEI